MDDIKRLSPYLRIFQKGSTVKLFLCIFALSMFVLEAEPAQISTPPMIVSGTFLMIEPVSSVQSEALDISRPPENLESVLQPTKENEFISSLRSEPQTETAVQPKTKKRSKIVKIAQFPVKTAVWPFRNVRKSLVYATMALGFVPVPHARMASIGGSFLLTALMPSSHAAAFVDPSPIAAKENDPPVLTRQEVVAAGKMPYLRYTVPEGELDMVSSSIFEQPPYTDSNKAAVEKYSRDLASNLGLVGATVWNEWPGTGMAPKVILSGKAVVIYERTSQGIIHLYFLADCRYKGKPWANRIKLISAPPPAQTAQAQQPIVVQSAVPPITNNMTAPAFPGTINLNLSGLPQQQALPTDTTQRIIYSGEVVQRQIVEVKRDWAAKMKDVGFGIMGSGVGVGAAALGIELPPAIENSAHAKADAVKYNADKNLQVQQVKSAADQQIAVTNGQALVDAAKNRVPDVVDIKTVGVNEPSVNNTSTVSPTTTVNPTNNVSANPTNNVSANPTNTVSPVISSTNDNNAQGGTGLGGAAAEVPPITITTGPVTAVGTGGNGQGGDGGKATSITGPVSADSSSKSDSNSKSDSGSTVSVNNGNTNTNTSGKEDSGKENPGNKDSGGKDNNDGKNPCNNGKDKPCSGQNDGGKH
jgi:hypothetical protein